MPELTVGTAGHIDHGKTALIRALTGKDTDRLPEEKARGISIDLGFAEMRLDEDLVVGVVDVPGHERFIRNMLAGVSGIDAVILVIAADEGVMPQTREHLDIIDLLGIDTGVVALTKIDLVEAEWAELVEEEVAEVLRGTSLEGAPVVRVSSMTGEGLDELRRILAAALRNRGGRARSPFTRLPVDRAFSVPGRGTVLTGTLFGGRIAAGDKLALLPPGHEVRVREVQVHGRPVEAAVAGQRTAVNVADLEVREVERGRVLAVPEFFVVTTHLAATLRLLSGPRVELRAGDRVRIHVGTSETIARVIPLEGPERMKPGEERLVRFRSERPLVAARGDLYVIRSYSPMITIGGGRVLDVGKRYRRRELDLLRARRDLGERELVLFHLARERELPATAEQVGRRLHVLPSLVREVLDETPEVVRVPGWDAYIHQDPYSRLVQRVREFLENWHERRPLARGAPREEVHQRLMPDLDGREFKSLMEVMEASGLLKSDGEILRLPEFTARLEGPARETADRILEALAESGFSPPPPEELFGFPQGRAVLAYLVDTGEVTRLPGDIFMLTERVREALDALERFLDEHGEVELGQFRDLLGTSRKFAMALLEHFDQRKVTTRVGDKRVRAGRRRQPAEELLRYEE